MKDIYDFQARTPKGDDLPMSAFRGKAVLVVNTATKCGLAPQFRDCDYWIPMQSVSEPGAGT